MEKCHLTGWLVTECSGMKRALCIRTVQLVAIAMRAHSKLFVCYVLSQINKLPLVFTTSYAYSAFRIVFIECDHAIYTFD